MPEFSVMLAPLATLYGAVSRARVALYARGRLPTYNAGAPVISVGNLTTGGTGKTPLVEMIARELATTGKRVCILTRGYGRENPRARVIVSDGKTIFADVRTGGDEPILLAQALLDAGVAIVSDGNRAAAAKWAISHLQSEVFLLDDGFQHLRLQRDLNLLTIDATNSFGGGYLLPRGRLREPLTALSRADAFVITRAELSEDLTVIRQTLKTRHPSAPIFTVRTKLKNLRRLPENSAPQIANFESGKFANSYLAFCALGNPQAFFSLLQCEELKIAATKTFRDHHAYAQKDLDRLTETARAVGATALITTAKDAVKLGALNLSLPCYVAEIALEIDEKLAFSELLRQSLNRAT